MSSAMEQPKKPVGGAYGMFMAEKRPEFQKACAGQKVVEVTKKGSEAWKKLTEAQKSVYQKKYEETKVQFEMDMAAFLEGGGEKTKGQRALQTEKRKAKERKKVKDTNAPKRPSGGGYGIYIAENRAKIVKSLPAGSNQTTDVAKAAGAQWKALSDAEKKPFNDKFLKKQEEYHTELAEYTKNLPEDARKEEEEETLTKASPKKQGKGKRKAGAEDTGSAPPAKKAKVEKLGKVGKTSKLQAPVIDADVLKKAQGLNLEETLKNLMVREEIKAKDFPQMKLLDALEESGGLVNKAKHALLGA